MNNRPPLSESLAGDVPSAGWANWLTQIFLCLPWKKGMNITATLDFGAVPANSQLSLNVTITGARAGDAVQIAPLADVGGIIFTGVVTAANTVTVYAKNITVGAVNPASQDYRVIVLQD